MSINTDQVDVRGPRFIAWVPTVAPVAAVLNAAFGICLGCQLYPLVARLRRAPTPA
jgi:hypothetical protein